MRRKKSDQRNELLLNYEEKKNANNKKPFNAPKTERVSTVGILFWLLLPIFAIDFG